MTTFHPGLKLGTLARRNDRSDFQCARMRREIRRDSRVAAQRRVIPREFRVSQGRESLI